MNSNRDLTPVAELSNRKTKLQIYHLPAKLGRNDNTVDVYYFNESISREHCLFEVINGRITICDLNSTVGTFVNGSRLDPNVPYYVEDGDKVTIGKVKFRFKVDYDALVKQASMPAQEPEAGRYRDFYPRQDYIPDDSAPQVMNQGVPGKKRITVSARKLEIYEYEESEVITLDCGLIKQTKQLRFTQDLKKKELDKASAAAVSAAFIEDPKPDPKPEVRKEPPATPEVTGVIRNESPAAPKVTGAIADKPAAAPEAKEIKMKELAEVEPLTESTLHDAFADEETVILAEERPAPPVPEIQLSWTDEESGEKGTLTVDKFPFYVGRKSGENDYVIRKSSASRRHMHFSEKDGVCSICDDCSSNGVRLNGERIPPEQDVNISAGDRIKIARVMFTVDKIS